MQSRIFNFAQACKSSSPWARARRPARRGRLAQFVCKNCQSKFSTSSILRKIAQASKQAAKNGEKKGVDKKYPEKLLIYDAGDMRTTFVSFWKSTALFQFGCTVAFLAPILYTNENQPDPNIRLLQAVGVTVLGAVPTLAMSYLTAPFVRKVFMQLPSHARYSREALMAFCRRIPSDTRLEFSTLRIFPFQHNTTAFMFELRALPPQKGRFANIELMQTDAWVERQRQKSLARRFWEVLKEPRFKFYVKEGRMYTIKTGVPGVWESVAKAIQQQTDGTKATALAKEITPAQRVKLGNVVGATEKQRVVKRQTARVQK